MASDFIPLIKNRLNRLGVFSVGCSKRDLERLEDYIRFALPRTYKDFLAHFGRGAGNHLDDLNIFYDRIFENRNVANDLLEEERSDFVLKETDFVFATYQGGQFLYFSVVEGDDPPVFSYSEGSGFPSKTHAKFSEFIIDLFEDVYGKLN